MVNLTHILSNLPEKTKDILFLFSLTAFNEAIAHLILITLWKKPLAVFAGISLVLLFQLIFDNVTSRLLILFCMMAPVFYQPFHVAMSKYLTGGNAWTWNSEHKLGFPLFLIPLFGLAACSIIHLDRLIKLYQTFRTTGELI